MNGLLIVALVCAAGMSPDECTPANALTKLVRPCAGELACAKDGQAVLAEAGLATDREPGTYVKIIIRRRKVAVAGGSAAE